MRRVADECRGADIHRGAADIGDRDKRAPLIGRAVARKTGGGDFCRLIVATGQIQAPAGI